MLREVIPVYNYIKEKCISYGEFHLSSGLTVNRYFDMRKLMLDPTVSDKLILLLDDLRDVKRTFNSIGGMESGAIPLITLLCQKLQKQGFFLRKDERNHGLKNRLEGNFVYPALLVDDVVKTGRSIFKVQHFLQQENFSRRDTVVADRICIIDRRDSVLKGSQPQIHSLFTEEDF